MKFPLFSTSRKNNLATAWNKIHYWPLLQKIFTTPIQVPLSIRCYSHLFRLFKHAIDICSLQTTSRIAYDMCQDVVFIAAYFCRLGCPFAVTGLQQASLVCGFNQVVTLKIDNPASIAWFWMVKIYLFDSQCRSSPTLLPKNAYSGPIMVICEKKIFDVVISLLCKACVRSVEMSPSDSAFLKSLLTARSRQKQFVHTIKHGCRKGDKGTLMPLHFDMWCFLITVYISGKIFSSVFNLQNDISALLFPAPSKLRFSWLQPSRHV